MTEKRMIEDESGRVRGKQRRILESSHKRAESARGLDLAVEGHQRGRDLVVANLDQDLVVGEMMENAKEIGTKIKIVIEIGIKIKIVIEIGTKIKTEIERRIKIGSVAALVHATKIEN